MGPPPVSRPLRRAAAALSSRRVPLLAQAAQSPPVSAANSPGVITGGIQPLLEGQTARPLRYRPAGTDFVVRNGDLFFNRPVYGTISSFRVDAGDLPEFSLYLPGHGGNLKLGVIASGGAKWFAQANDIIARYRPGRMIYELRDPALGGGFIHIEILTAAEGSTMMLELRAQDIPAGITLAYAFAGASGRKGDRNGDIGCEKQPITQFFQVRPEECKDNAFTIEAHTCKLRSPAGDLQLTFPPSSQLAIADFSTWSAPPSGINNTTPNPQLPILTGSMPLTSEAPLYISIQHTTPQEPAVNLDLAAAFAARRRQIEAIATAVVLNTPDSYMNPVGGALTIAAEGLWDPKQECVMHGCVAWRSVFAGWRGPYSLDALGNHDRAKLHFRRWLKKQNISPITTSSPATGPADPRSYLARKESLLHSNGDLSNNHYDMNMVFFDVLLRHLRWTGDLDFAREIWPALRAPPRLGAAPLPPHLHQPRRQAAPALRGLRRHLGQRQPPVQRRRRQPTPRPTTSSPSAPPQHSRARSNEDPTPYEHEADAHPRTRCSELLWLPDTRLLRRIQRSPRPADRLHQPRPLDHVPHHRQRGPRQAAKPGRWSPNVSPPSAAFQSSGPGVPDGAWYLLACSDWLPYIWSLTLIALAENIHTALAMWQAGMADDAYLLLKGNVLDSMYQGQCPAQLPHVLAARRPPPGGAARLRRSHRHLLPRPHRRPLRHPAPTSSKTISPSAPASPPTGTTPHSTTPTSTTHGPSTAPPRPTTLTSRLPKAVPLTLNLRARTTTLPEVTQQRHTHPLHLRPNSRRHTHHSK